MQVTLVYLGACWFVLQLVATLRDLLELPYWIGPVTVLLLAVGLLVVLATAWVQSLPTTTAAEKAGELPSDWEIAPGDALVSLRSGRLPHLTWGRAILGVVVAISLVIGAAGGYVLLTEEGPLATTPLGAEDGPAGVAVLPFTVAGPGLDEFGEGMVSLVSINIDGVDGIRSVSPRTVLAEWEETLGEARAGTLDEALRVAGATGAHYAVVGDVVSTGSAVRFSAELYDVADGTSAGRGGAEGPIDEVLPLVDEMSVDLLRTLIERSGNQSLTGIQRLDGLMTSSVEALRAYLEGEAHYRHGRIDAALESYERAVASDSTFALAWARISSAYGWIEAGNPRLPEARDRAFELVDRLPGREVTLIRGQADRARRTVTPDVLEALRRHVERFPDDPEGWAQLAEYYFHQIGVPHTQEQMEEALLTPVDLDPDFMPYYVHALRYLVGLGDWRFHEYMEFFRKIVDDDLVRRFQVLWDFYYGGDEARREAEAYYAADLEAGRNAVAEVYLASDSIGERSLVLTRLAWAERSFRPAAEARILANLGRFDEIPRAPSEVEPLGTGPRLLIALARGGLALLSDASVDGVSATEGAALVTQAVDASLGSATSEEPMPPPVVVELNALSEAARLLAAGEAVRAREVLEAVPSRGNRIRHLGWWSAFYAESLARMGDLAGAAAYYEANLRRWRGLGRLRLGELYEELGEVERARVNYAGFLRLFRNADEGAAELVGRARAGLTRVGG